jgi:hypothetical protein
MKKLALTIFGFTLFFTACHKSSIDPQTCLPAMDSEGAGVGKWISVDDPETPKEIETERRRIITDNLNKGDTIYLDGNQLIIHSFWLDSIGLKAAIKVEHHDSLVGSHAYKEDSEICW